MSERAVRRIFIKIYYLLIFIIFLIQLCGTSCLATENKAQGYVWMKILTGIIERDIHSMDVTHDDFSKIYIGTSQTLFQGNLQGQKLKSIFQILGQSNSINQIHVSKDNSNLLYLATNNGLFESQNAGQTWSKLFSSSNQKSNACLSILLSKNKIFLGTQNGLFFKNITDANWTKESFFDSSQPVIDIKQDTQYIYFVTDRKIIRYSKISKLYKEIYSVGLRIDEEEQDINFHKSITSFGIYLQEHSTLYLTRANGLYRSDDQGDNWHKVPSGNSLPESVTSLVVFENKSLKENKCKENEKPCVSIFVGSDKGVFSFESGNWMALYKGMETQKVKDMVIDAKNTVYAATDKGIYKLHIDELPPLVYLPNFTHEPTINDVHAMAIEYGEVSKNKIDTWRKQARRKAWFPKLGVGFDRDWDVSYSDTIYGTSSNGGTHYVGPDDKSTGNDYGWDVSLSWDLADLVYNSEQTSIDSRSKLMVELREDILDQVTRLYFERRRLQLELAQISNFQWEQEKQLRISELTAHIDALTGGKFSRNILKGNFTNE